MTSAQRMSMSAAFLELWLSGTEVKFLQKAVWLRNERAGANLNFSGVAAFRTASIASITLYMYQIHTSVQL